MSEPDDPGTDLVRRASEEFGEEVVEEVGRFLGTIFGSASIEMDALLGGRVAWWRFKQQVRLAEKAKKLCEEKGFAPQAVPLRTSIPLLESGSLAEDDDLVDRWAALLANATAHTVDVPPSFPNVLAEIEPAAAHLLDAIYAQHMTVAPELRKDVSVITDDEVEVVGSRAEYEYHMDNLVRLGVIRSGTLSGDFYRSMSLTGFGEAFVKACRPPGTPDPVIVWTDKTKLQQHIMERNAAETAAEARRTADTEQ